MTKPYNLHIILNGTFYLLELPNCGKVEVVKTNERNKFMKTFMQTKENIERKWYVIDAEGQTLGRLATKAATILRGKHKVTYTPHVDCGDYVIVINASKINLTGNKLEDKMYYNHSGYPGGLRERNAKTMIEKYSEEMIERAVKGMLPHGPLGRAMGKKLFVYSNADHKHEAQKPTELKID